MSHLLSTSHLWRRLQKLEAQMTDECALVPYSNKWRAYWTAWVQKLVNGEDPPGKIPEEAYRAVIDDVVPPPPPVYDDE